jgi:PAS domain-containing protein
VGEPAAIGELDGPALLRREAFERATDGLTVETGADVGPAPVERAISTVHELRIPVLVGGPAFYRSPQLWRGVGADHHGTYSIGEAAAMVGLIPHTIRAWERRHRALTPARSGNRPRRYRLEDVETLKRIKDVAGARGLSLRLTVAQAAGELPELSGAGVDALVDEAEPAATDGGPWRAVADLDARPLLIIDRRGRGVDCNVAFARLCGELRFRLPGATLSDLVDPFDRAKAVAIYRGAPEPDLGWELNLRTPVVVGLFSFDCLPFRYREGGLIACTGHRVV